MPAIVAPDIKQPAAATGDGRPSIGGYVEPAPVRKAKDANGKSSLIACFVSVTSTLHGSSVFMVCFLTTAVYGGYRLEAICPLSDFTRMLTNLASPLMFASRKAWFSEICNDEDTVWRYFYDTWPKTLVTGTDSYAQIVAGALGFWGLFKTARLVLFIYSVAVFYAIVTTTLLIVQVAVSSCFVWHSAGASLVSGLTSVIELLNSPITALHTYVMEPIGRFVCSIPVRALKLIGVDSETSRVPNPVFVFLFMAIEKDHINADLHTSSVADILSAGACWARIKQAGGTIIKWLIAAFVINTAIRLVFTALGGGYYVVYAWGLIVTAGTGAADYVSDQQRMYRLLTYGGAGDAVMVQVVVDFIERSALVFAHPQTWIVIAAIVACSVGLQSIERASKEKGSPAPTLDLSPDASSPPAQQSNPSAAAGFVEPLSGAPAPKG